MNKTIKLNVLALSICLAQQAYALQPISDHSLSQVTGQDGISITHEVSKVTIDQLNWVDYHNTGSMKLGMHDVEVLSSGGQNIKSTLDVFREKGARNCNISSVRKFDLFQDGW